MDKQKNSYDIIREEEEVENTLIKMLNLKKRE